MLLRFARQTGASKGSDKMLHGFASAIARGIKRNAIDTRVEQEIARKAKRCAEKTGIESRVAWSPPPDAGLVFAWPGTIGQSILCLDQFQLGVFGLIMPKAMACGAAVLMSHYYRDNALVFSDCATGGTLFQSRRNCISVAISEDPVLPTMRRGGQIGAASREWVKRHHSSERVTHRPEKAIASAGGVFAKRRFAA